MTIRLITPTFLIVTTLAACGGSPPPAPEPDVVRVLQTRPSLTQFTEALKSTGVADSLFANGAYTVFVPFDKAVSGPLDAATIRHHILAERVTFSDMAGESTSYTTLNDDEIEIDVTEQIVIGSGLMVESDIGAANGIIHVIDQVQIPEAPEVVEEDTEPAAPAEPITTTVIPAAPAIEAAE